MNLIKFETPEGKRVSVRALQGVDRAGAPLQPSPAKVKAEGVKRGWKLVGKRQRRSA